MTALVSTIAEVRQAVGQARDRNLKLGLVPTMGALHAGHASLIRAARAQSGFVVVSIFVNPTQFGPGEDFSRYPRTLEADLDVCRREGVDLVFAPAAETMYPADFHTYVEVHDLQDVLCGPSRPGHFRGVATVVCKLFNIVQPDVAYFGQKDFQQARIIQQLVGDLNLPLEVRICPTIREADGLALSSRNRYLNGEQRSHATVLYRSLQEVKAAVEKGERKVVEQLLTQGADINARTESGETALHYAAFPKDAWFAARLIKAGADPRAVNSAGESPLFWAALEGNVAVARTLLAQHADANARDAKGNLPLHAAAHNGEAAMVRLLLPQTKDPNARNREGLTPRNYAAASGHKAVLKLLEGAHQ